MNQRTEQAVERARRVRLLASAADVAAFDEALAAIGRHRDRKTLARLFTVFDDGCTQEEVMFGLVHLVEDFPDNVYFDVLLDNVVPMQERARSWCELLLTRILNDDRTRGELDRRLGSANSRTQAALAHSLEQIENEAAENRKLARFARSTRALLSLPSRTKQNGHSR